MLIDFFYTLRSAKLPVSVKEYLTLVEALKEGVVGPNSEDGYKIDDFYYLSRTTLVKDEKHYDKFDRAFAAYFKGVEMIADFTQDIPLEWLRKNLELNLSPEELAKIQKMGWDELMETIKKRLEEQRERHENSRGKQQTGRRTDGPEVRTCSGAAKHLQREKSSGESGKSYQREGEGSGSADGELLLY